MSSSKEKQIIAELVEQATENRTKILSTKDIIDKYPKLYWGGNGVGDRWANKQFNYSSVYTNKPPITYSENEEDEIPEELLNEFLQNNKGPGIIGIYVHSRRTNTETRPIRKDILEVYKRNSCVVCGTGKTICDHKNDLYNDPRVLSADTQTLDDFQALCTHCNLQKRQVCKLEKETNRIYSAKNISAYRAFPFEFPWEKHAFDIKNINCKTGTYWFDPVEFNKKIYYYSLYVIPIVNEIKRKIKQVN